jgi:hypothetical protein
MSNLTPRESIKVIVILSILIAVLIAVALTGCCSRGLDVPVSEETPDAAQGVAGSPVEPLPYVATPLPAPPGVDMACPPGYDWWPLDGGGVCRRGRPPVYPCDAGEPACQGGD